MLAAALGEFEKELDSELCDAPNTDAAEKFSETP